MGEVRVETPAFHQSGKKQRLLDQTPYLSDAIDSMYGLQPEHQAMISQHVIHLGEEYTLVRQKEMGLKSIGQEKLTGLMKSKRRRRWYDQSPMNHKAFNHLYLMDEYQRTPIAFRIFVIAPLIQRYVLDNARRIRPVHDQTVWELVENIFRRDLEDLVARVTRPTQSSAGGKRPPPGPVAPVASPHRPGSAHPAPPVVRAKRYYEGILLGIEDNRIIDISEAAE